MAAPAPAAGARAERSTLVLLVRHAEKADPLAADPPLSATGTTRALALRDALADAGVTAVIVTPRLRTRDTARPLAEARGLTPEVVDLGAGGATHAQAVAAAVRRHAGGVVLVVGHSNTIPAIIAALGGPRLPDLCDANYTTLFAVSLDAPADPSRGARVVRARYGAPDPPGAESCATQPAMR